MTPDEITRLAERAADMLDGFEKALLRYAPIEDIEEWPYHPDITDTAEQLRALARTDHVEDKLGVVPEALQQTCFKEDDPERFGHVTGWNACRDAMLAAAPAPDHSAGAGGSFDIYEAYKGWPDDLRKKLSLHDLRRMNGWGPANAVDPMAERSRRLIVGFMLDCNAVGMVGAAENLGKAIKEAALAQPVTAGADGGK